MVSHWGAADGQYQISTSHGPTTYLTIVGRSIVVLAGTLVAMMIAADAEMRLASSQLES